MTSYKHTLHLHPDDNVAIAKVALHPGMEIVVALSSGERQKLTIKGDIPPGHKVSLTHLDSGDIVRRYGQVIGTASEIITPGEHIHTHNLSMADHLEGDILDSTGETGNPSCLNLSSDIYRVSQTEWKGWDAQLHRGDGECKLFSIRLQTNRSTFHT